MPLLDLYLQASCSYQCVLRSGEWSLRPIDLAKFVFMGLGVLFFSGYVSYSLNFFTKLSLEESLKVPTRSFVFINLS